MNQSPIQMRMLIVADDLSGAADCAIPCVAAGLQTLVALGETAGSAPPTEVLALDADTRRLAPEDAAAHTGALLRRLGQAGQIWFKKFDSTLRGNVGAELAATLAAQREWAPDAFALVAPAFPATGRQTRGGRQYLNNVPVEETEVWKREGIQGRAHMPTLAVRAGLRATHVPLDVVRAGQMGLSAALAQAGAAHDAVVCDAETDADLRAIAKAGVALSRQVLWAGTAGLARYLPKTTRLGHDAPSREALAPARGPVLFVVGSMSGVSHGQVTHLTAAGGLQTLVIPPHVLRAGEGYAEWTAALRALDEALSAGQDVVVQLGMEEHVDVGEGLALCRALSWLVAPFAARIGGLVSTGGETARAVLMAFGAAGLRLRSEIEPGVALSVTEGGASGPHGLPVITKAGAFGHPDTLLRCRAVLHQPSLLNSIF
ncbi:four-carbon acid sugar kinase family protein [Acidocella sp.]|uniref:four-carbon acid sugar kinase family protein n=1 Tax=Acidocella sp. TaxID=50710 RepID=UPI003D093F48